MQILNFDAGEVRRLEYTVSAQSPSDAIVISSATWELAGKTGEPISGSCEVSENKISLVVPLDEAGYYTLTVTVVIPPETIIEKMGVRVV